MRIGIMVAAASPLNEITAVLSPDGDFSVSGKSIEARPEEPVFQES
jgi:hypothetical protein